MARKLTPERQKLRVDAIRIRQELGWSIRVIAGHLRVPKSDIHQWLSNNGTHAPSHNTPPLSPNNIYCMLCLTGTLAEVLERLTREQAEDFVKEINERLEKQTSLF